MTDAKKTSKEEAGAKPKKLQLNKETIKDLSARGAEKIRGGLNRQQCGDSNSCPSDGPSCPDLGCE